VQQAKKNITSAPIAATFATDSLFALSGFFNVILLLYTKPNVGLFGNLVLVSPQQLPESTLSGSQEGGNQKNENGQIELREFGGPEEEGALPP